ncbi:MAG TPA: fumarylacetoacetate hydrolase family protein [Mycobacteriales bacterium]|nr:fumarylacetoacetate hydrolase family protein [Mycobacteriales bacterium]
MKLLSYRRAGAIRHGILRDSTVEELGDGDLRAHLAAPSAPDLTPLGRYPLADVDILAPVTRPGKVLAVAANYQEHIVEGGGARIDKSALVPRLFLKPGTAVANPGDPIRLPEHTQQMDWEAELVVVIGRTARDVAVQDALGIVGGYATGNDVSARSVDYGFEREGGAPGASAVWFFDWLAGKWFDGFAPYGPYLVTPDEIPDPQNLDVTLEVNGKVRQDGNTADMIFTVAELVSFSSKLMTLEPGDVIFTGTPAGVGAATGEFLSAGDEMSVRVGSLGTLVNSVQ